LANLFGTFSSLVHEILGIRARIGVPADGRIPTIACGMSRVWPRGVKKWFAVAHFSIWSDRPEPAQLDARGLFPGPNCTDVGSIPAIHSKAAAD
jgi:hypothetical protein